MGRIGRPVVALAAGSVVVAVVGTSVALSRGEVPVARAATTVSDARDARILSPAGVLTVAHRGQRVPDGDVVRTGRHGMARLVTRGREVWVGRSAALAVVDGAHQQLRAGRAVFDARRGPGLAVDIAGYRLSVPGGSATEALRSVTVRVGALTGPDTLAGASGARLRVAPLFQAVVNGDALPTAATPLRLTDDAAEAHAVPGLVDDDVALDHLAQGINSSGPSTARAVEAAWSGQVEAVPAVAPRSERVLPILIADSTARYGETVETRYDRAVGWRRAGGSWGVVDALLSGRASGVENALAGLRAGPAGQIGSVSLQALAAPRVATRGAGPGDRPTTPSHGGVPRALGGGGGRPTTAATHPTTHAATHPGAVAKVVGTVTGVVSNVLKLLPVKTAKSPASHSTGSSGGLLGGLLGK
jgi:hypothetical protein